MTEQTETIMVELDLRDVAMAVQIIDLAAERGGFRGPEMQVLGEYRGRLAELVQRHTPEQPEEAQGAE